jgi:chemotaxis signal transduction protein
VSELELTLERPLTEVDLLLFEVGGELFGTDAAQVLRISAADSEAVVLPNMEGSPDSPRALVFGVPGSAPREAQLRVDVVRGVMQVQVGQLRRMPPAASARPWAVGLWLDGDRPVVLIDLEKVAAMLPPAESNENQASTQVT